MVRFAAVVEAIGGDAVNGSGDGGESQLVVLSEMEDAEADRVDIAGPLVSSTQVVPAVAAITAVSVGAAGEMGGPDGRTGDAVKAGVCVFGAITAVPTSEMQSTASSSLASRP